MTTEDSERTARLVRRKPVPSSKTSASDFNHAPATLSNKLSNPEDNDLEDMITPAHPAPRWKPFWLKTTVLSSLLVLFLVICLALIVLWRQTTHDGGLRLTITTNHYAWTYGPTAVLVVVVSFWRLVDWHCKFLMPWYEMQRGLSPASRTLLLDYQWPFQATSLQNAIRKRHIAVIASITGFILLKVVVIASTGLLVLLSTTQSVTVPVTSTARYSNATTILNTTSGLYEIKLGNVYASYLGSVQGVPLNTTGVVIVDKTSFPPFEYIPTVDEYQSVSAEVEFFVPNITCEKAEVIHWQADSVKSSVHFDLSSSICPLHKVSPNGYDFVNISRQIHDNISYNQSLRFDTSLGNCADYALSCDEPLPYQIAYEWSRVNCTPYREGDRDNDQYFRPDPLVGSYAYAFYALNMTNTVILPRQRTTDNSSMFNHSLTSSSAVICKVNHNIIRGTAVHETSTGEWTVGSMDGEPYHLSGVSDLGLSESLFPNTGSDWVYQQMTIFDFLVESSGGGETGAYDRFFDANLLMSVAPRVWTGLMNVLMGQMYMEPASDDLEGVAKYDESRLYLGVMSLWTMAALLLVVSVLTVLVMTTMRSVAMSQDVRLMASQAMILANSESLQKLLRNKSQFSEEKMAKALVNTSFSAQFGIDCGVECSVSAIALTKSHKGDQKSPTWMPLSARAYIIGLTLLLPVIAVVIIECLYKVSQEQNGLLRVASSASASVYAIRYFTTFIVLGIATLYNMLEFATLTLAPFDRLHSHARPAIQSLLSHLPGYLPPVALYKASVSRQFGPVCCIIAAIMGNTLSIIVSGLWSINLCTEHTPSVMIELTSSWTTSWPNSVINDSEATSVFSDVEHGLIQTPPRIWNHLVLPDMRLVAGTATPSATPRSSINYTAVVPALRARLECDTVPADHKSMVWGIPTDYLGFSLVNVSATYMLPDGCRGGPNGDLDYIEFHMADHISGAGEVSLNGMLGISGKHAFLNDLHMSSWDANDIGNITGFWAGQPATKVPDNPVGCPSLGVFMGNFSSDLNNTDEFAALICYQRLEQIPTRVTFIDDPLEMQLSQDTPPQPQEQLALTLTNGTAGFDAFSYRIERHVLTGMYPFENDDLADYSLTDQNDYFFNYITLGPNRTTWNEFLPADGTVNTNLLLERVTDLYKRYMTFVIDRQLRVPIPTTTSSTTDHISATASTEVYRLKISYGSKLTLQILLSIMTALGIATHLLVDFRTTLPGPPTSIAAVMSLFADSELCDPKTGIIVPGATYMTAKELEMTLSGWRFSLGWWRGDVDDEEVGPELEPDGRTEVSAESQNFSNDGTDTPTTMTPVPRTSATKRFGIDIGTAEILGFRTRKSWKERMQGLRGGARERKKKREETYDELSQDHSTSTSTST